MPRSLVVYHDIHLDVEWDWRIDSSSAATPEITDIRVVSNPNLLPLFDKLGEFAPRTHYPAIGELVKLLPTGESPMPANILPSLAKAWRAKREARLAAQKEVDKMEEIERDLKEKVMKALQARKLETGAVIDGYVYQILRKQEPTVEDWVELYKHVKKTGEFDLLYKRVNPAAIKERWDDSKAVPGVAAFPVDTLSVTKAK